MAIKVTKKQINVEYTEGGPLLVVDADYLPYAIGSVCETNVLSVYLGDEFKFEARSKKELYENLPDYIKNKKDLDNKVANDPDWSDFRIEENLEIDEENNALHSTKLSIQNLVQTSKASGMKLYITVGSNNFRNEVATIVKYKSNRANTAKPYYYPIIRDYMIEEFRAEVSEGREAEDSVVEACYPLFLDWLEDCKADGLDPEIMMKGPEHWTGDHPPFPYIYVAKDKDVFQLPGLLMNPDNKDKKGKIITEWVTPLGEFYKKGKTMKFNGLKGLYCQILTGDSIDAIPGIRGMATLGASELLKDCTTEAEMLEVVTETWENSALDFNARWQAENYFYECHGPTGSGKVLSDHEDPESPLVGKVAKLNDWTKRVKERMIKEDEDHYSNGFHYYPWHCYKQDKHGVPVPELEDIAGEEDMVSLSAEEIIKEVATLLWIRHYVVDKGDDVTAPVGEFRKELGL